METEKISIKNNAENENGIITFKKEAIISYKRMLPAGEELFYEYYFKLENNQEITATIYDLKDFFNERSINLIFSRLMELKDYYDGFLIPQKEAYQKKYDDTWKYRYLARYLRKKRLNKFIREILVHEQDEIREYNDELYRALDLKFKKEI